MAIPYKPRGALPFGSNNNHTRYHQSFMVDMEYDLPEWQVDAECRKHDPELFSLSSSDSSDFIKANDGLKTVEQVTLFDFNEAKVEQALKACSSCLVKDECGKSAIGEDRIHTVRGGMRPIKLTTRVGKPKKVVTEAPDRTRNGKVCPRGHTGEWRQSPSSLKWQCGTCSLLLRKGAVEPIIPQMQKQCHRGHNDWYENSERRQCRTCALQRRKDYGAKMKA